MANWLSIEEAIAAGLACPTIRDVVVMEEDSGPVHVQVQDLSGRFAQNVILTEKRNARQQLSDTIQVPVHTIQFDMSTVTARVSVFNFLQRDVMQHSDVVAKKLREDGVPNAFFYGETCPCCGDAESERCMTWLPGDIDDTQCKCEWCCDVCDKCLIRDNNNIVVCPRCADLETLSVGDQKAWFSNIAFFNHQVDDLDEKLGPKA